MQRTPDAVTDDELLALGLMDAPRARQLMMSLAGQGVTDEVVGQLLPALFTALAASPDPERALTNFVRWTESVTSRYTHIQYLIGHPTALQIFFNVCGVSQFFSDILIRNPEYLEILANEPMRRRAKNAADLYRDVSSMVDGVQRPEMKLEVMRRFRLREVLRIGTRDILGLADMPSTAREFSCLADACIQKVYEISVQQLRERYGIDPPIPFCVVAMGKLGGLELNYSSDIDLMYVAGDEPIGDVPNCPVSPMEYAHKLAELIGAGLAKNTYNGHLFRVDLRLRPEGRFGALVRTLSSYRTYYESWAEGWERQALLKARTVAGDTRLCQAFAEMVTPFVYRSHVSADFIEEIRHNKDRIEKKAELEGKTHTNVKIGYGGIRDIEFTAQLLQLQLGGRYPILRTPTTLEALARLRQLGLISALEADEMTEDYCFLRNVEHRLQILYEMQTQNMPTEPDERRLLARRLGYPDTDAFNADYKRRTERTHQHCLTLFYGAYDRHEAHADGWRDLLDNVDSAGAHDIIVQRLTENGFVDAERAYGLLKLAAFGGDYGLVRPEAHSSFVDIAARLVGSCARTGDPDAALEGIEHLAMAMPNRAQLYRTLGEGDDILHRLCVLGASSPALIQNLSRHLEWLDMLVSEQIVDPAAKPADLCLEELEERVGAIKKDDAFWKGVALYAQRERMRIGARDLWGEVNAQTVSLELTGLAEAVLDTLLRRAIRKARERWPLDTEYDPLQTVALIGLGKLGGRELGYGSDWDIVITYTADGAGDATVAGATLATQVNFVAEFILAAAQELRTRGAEVEIDARLRPEGRFGALARTVDECGAYYRDNALTWERQVLTKARAVAGCARTGELYMRAVHQAIYSQPMTAEAAEEIRHMKGRIENERLKPNERFSDLKLGNGGLSDIEFMVQFLQLRHASAYPPVRRSETLQALHALSAAGAVPAPDSARLADAYTVLTAIRNRITLLGGLAADALPEEERRLRALAIGLGVVDTPGVTAGESLKKRVRSRMVETRAIVERLFN